MVGEGWPCPLRRGGANAVPVGEGGGKAIATSYSSTRDFNGVCVVLVMLPFSAASSLLVAVAMLRALPTTTRCAGSPVWRNWQTRATRNCLSGSSSRFMTMQTRPHCHALGSGRPFMGSLASASNPGAGTHRCDIARQRAIAYAPGTCESPVSSCHTVKPGAMPPGFRFPSVRDRGHSFPSLVPVSSAYAWRRFWMYLSNNPDSTRCSS